MCICVRCVRALCSELFYFFFSSRRRHTRCSRDWSSDVCSSDLNPMLQGQIYNPAPTSFVPVAAHTVTDPCTNNTVNVPAGFARQPYGGNIIPATDPLLSSLGAFMAPLIPNPDRNTLAVNGFGGTSAERRVGKECRSRWSPDHLKKKERSD